MVSLRQVANGCLGLTGSFSVNPDIYGYRLRDQNGRLFGVLQPIDTLPSTGAPTTRSLRRQLDLMRGQCINLSIILVGHEPDFSGVVTRDQITRVQYSIQVARDIFGQRNLGIRRIYWNLIGLSEVIVPELMREYTEIETRAEATSLTATFSIDNDGVDIFWVQDISGAGGWSIRDGPCDKTAVDVQSGVVIEILDDPSKRSKRKCGVLLAHEIGHYLGLPTFGSKANFMGIDPDNNGVDSIDENSTGFTSDQASDMKDHCSVKFFC